MNTATEASFLNTCPSQLRHRFFWKLLLFLIDDLKFISTYDHTWTTTVDALGRNTYDPES